MMKFEQFLEAKGESGQTKAIIDIIKAIQSAFKKLTRTRRKEAWDSISSKKGKKEISILVNNPDRPLARFRKLRGKK